MRRTGRTTRMLDHAKLLSLQGKAVYIMVADETQRAWFRTELGDRLDIQVETPNSLPGFDWKRWRSPGAHDNCVFLMDHHAGEEHFGLALEEMHRFDFDESIYGVGDHVHKDTGEYSFEGHVVSRFYKRDSFTVRYVVQDDRGICMIMSHVQLKLVHPSKPAPELVDFDDIPF